MRGPIIRSANDARDLIMRKVYTNKSQMIRSGSNNIQGLTACKVLQNERSNKMKGLAK